MAVTFELFALNNNNNLMIIMLLASMSIKYYKNRTLLHIYLIYFLLLTPDPLKNDA